MCGVSLGNGENLISQVSKGACLDNVFIFTDSRFIANGIISTAARAFLDTVA
jgi:hypothetical protein